MSIKIDEQLEKDSREVYIYTFDWTGELGGSTISGSNSTWSVSPSGLTIDAVSNTTTSTTFKMSGGVAGTKYRVTNEVVTAAGETLRLHVDVMVME